ncbi:hypothetical protein AAFN88_10250 [Pelagibius sp. CAU 1746]|uniref:hypothetical protein n=1 Tax=Pelagibius sp. CAU 1746 TaxID=3140370 RepID=UPI00325AEAB1
MADKPEEQDDFDNSKWSFDLKKLHAHLDGDTEADVIIKGHLYVEHVLIETLREALARPALLNIERLNFPAKAELCAAMNLIPEDALRPVKYVNAMRNKIAHDLEFAVGTKEKLEFFKLFPKMGQELIREDKKPGQSKDPGSINLGHYFMVLAIIMDCFRLRYIEQKKKREEAYENAKRVLDLFKEDSEGESSDEETR